MTESEFFREIDWN